MIFLCNQSDSRANPGLWKRTLREAFPKELLFGLWGRFERFLTGSL